MSKLSNFYNNFVSETSPLSTLVNHPLSALSHAENRFAQNQNNGARSAIDAFFTPQRAYASPAAPTMPSSSPGQIPPWQQQGFSSQDEYNANNGIQTGNGYVDPGLLANSQHTQLAPPPPPPAPYSASPNLSAQASAPQGNNVTFFNGKNYDLSNPGQGKQYYSDRANYIDQMAQHQYAPIENQIKTSLGQGATQYGEQLAAIKRDLGNLGDQYGAYNHNYNEGITNANQGYDLGAVNRQNMFAQASPNAFQSSQASGEQYAKTQLDKELGDMALNKSLTDKNYNQQEAGLNQQQQDLGTNYNLFTQQNQNALDQYKTNLNDYYGALKDQLGTNAIQSYGGATPNASQFNYTAHTGQPLQAVNTDISQYTPAINFQSLQGAPSANFFGGFQPQVTQPALSPLQQNLGQVPTQQDKNYIQQFLGS